MSAIPRPYRPKDEYRHGPVVEPSRASRVARRALVRTPVAIAGRSIHPVADSGEGRYRLRVQAGLIEPCSNEWSNPPAPSGTSAELGVGVPWEQATTARHVALGGTPGRPP